MNEFINIKTMNDINNGYVESILFNIICKYNISTFSEVYDRVKFKITVTNPKRYFCYVDEKFDNDFTYEIIYEI